MQQFGSMFADTLPTLSSLRSAPRAFANWLGVSGRDEKPAARIMLFHGTPRREAAALERQLRWLKGRFDVVPLRSIVTAASATGAVGDKLALTFDDGLRSNVEVAYPILHRLALPATFFVCPGLVDRESWLWTHEVRRRLARLDAAARRELAREWNAPEETEAFVGWMKELRAAERKQVETRLRDATPAFAPTRAEREEFDLASWRELSKLDPAIISIGSHTLTHPILPSTQPAELETEVRDSRRQLERGLQRPVDLFAYPNGDLNREVEACVRRHYRAAVTSSMGWVRRGTDTHRLPRLGAPRGVLRLARRIYP
ncbi:MAG TPA: polysaccharide deacetylase family protein [Burkholderiales bacterium]|nr:polysaccharide deacetylase family protein [Burkholderiales bacterium]